MTIMDQPPVELSMGSNELRGAEANSIQTEKKLPPKVKNIVTRPFANTFNSKLSTEKDRLESDAYDPSNASKDDVAAGSPAHRKPIPDRRHTPGVQKKSVSYAGDVRRNSDEDCKGSHSDEGDQSRSHRKALPMPKQPWALRSIYPVIPGRFYFTVSNQSLRAKSKFEQIFFEEGQYSFFTSNLPAQYFPFCSDYGPTNLGVLYRFVDFLDKKMKAEPQAKLCFRVSENVAIRTNAAFLMAAYLMIRKGLSPEEAWEPFSCIEPMPFTTYRDATFARADFTINILDCLQGLHKAMSIGWFDMETFPVEDYEHYDHPDNGDLHLLCPKALGFKGPMDPQHASPDDISQEAKFYLPIFRQKGVSAVVRLNNANTYKAQVFKSHGINHHDLYFDDCTTPTEGIIERFFNIMDSEEGIVAVHCKAGLGRTGTLIGLWIMRNYGFTAKEVIAWMRLCRPGSVIGPQQHFLQAWEMREAHELDDQSGSSPGGGKSSTLRTKLYQAIGNSISAEQSEALAMQVSNGSNSRAARVKHVTKDPVQRTISEPEGVFSSYPPYPPGSVHKDSRSGSSPHPLPRVEVPPPAAPAAEKEKSNSSSSSGSWSKTSHSSSLKRLGQFFSRNK